MAKEKKEIRSDLWVGRLASRFASAAGRASAASLEMGAVFSALISGERSEVERFTALSKRDVIVALSKQAACDAVNAATGGGWSVRRLNALATAAATFVADGGIQHGSHAVTADDIAVLELPAERLAELASAMEAGKVRVADVERQVRRVRNNPAKLGDAQKRVSEKLTAAQDDSIDAKIDAAKAKVERCKKALAKAEAALMELLSESDTAVIEHNAITSQEAVAA